NTVAKTSSNPISSDPSNIWREILMGRRSSHGAVVRLAGAGLAAKVERWSPPPAWGEDREQGYLHRVRPQSDRQRPLLESIARGPLTIALGPAGTGKT